MSNTNAAFTLEVTPRGYLLYSAGSARLSASAACDELGRTLAEAATGVVLRPG